MEIQGPKALERELGKAANDWSATMKGVEGRTFPASIDLSLLLSCRPEA